MILFELVYVLYELYIFVQLMPSRISILSNLTFGMQQFCGKTLLFTSFPEACARKKCKTKSQYYTKHCCIATTILQCTCDEIHNVFVARFSIFPPIFSSDFHLDGW